MAVAGDARSGAPVPTKRSRAIDLLQAIGNTPLVELMDVDTRSGVRILCELEGCNPGGSVRGRPALSLVARAEERGDLTTGKAIVEAQALLERDPDDILAHVETGGTS